MLGVFEVPIRPTVFPLPSNSYHLRLVHSLQTVNRLGSMITFPSTSKIATYPRPVLLVMIR